MLGATSSGYWDQGSFDVRCEWGPRGVAALASLSDVVVIVDVISFCTCVDIAVARGASVYPFGWGDEGAAEFARRIGGQLAGFGDAVLPFSASAMLSLRHGARLVLPSPNGGALSALAARARPDPLPNPPPVGEGSRDPLPSPPPVGEGSRGPLPSPPPVGEGSRDPLPSSPPVGEGSRGPLPSPPPQGEGSGPLSLWERVGERVFRRRGRASEPIASPPPVPQPVAIVQPLPAAVAGPVVFAGCLRNARAVAAAAARAGQRVAVIPAGERWREDAYGDRSLRPAIEDLIGAGAIIDALPGRRSPEAEMAVAAFRAARGRLPALLLACSSGREHAAKGTEPDVELAAQLNASDFAPRLVDGAYVAGAGGTL